MLAVDRCESNPQPLGYESDTLPTGPLHPHGLYKTDLGMSQFYDGGAAELRIGTFDGQAVDLAVSEVVRKQLRLAECMFARRTVGVGVLPATFHPRSFISLTRKVALLSQRGRAVLRACQ